MNYLDMNLWQVKELLDKGEVTSEQLTSMCFEQIEKTKEINALLSLCKESALKTAKEIDEKRKKGEELGALAGIPVVLKDNINYINTKTTCASKFLENWVSPFTATCAQKLIDAGAVIIGKANMDEFAMGSSTENSAFGVTKNPCNTAYVPGGSSGGSAASVASKQCFASLGTDTGGSIREPASFCGVVGLKPTYGRVSRSGVVAFASSLDQVGSFTRCAKDSAIMLSVLAGKDKLDMTSSSVEVENYVQEIKGDVKGLKIGIAKQFFSDKLDDEVKTKIQNAISVLTKNGATTVEIDLPSIDVALAVYYIVSSAEAASNLARFDGIRYGVRAKNYEDLVDLYVKSRTQGFGKEVKRRIMLGNYVLSSGYFDAFYRKAKKVQKIIKQEFLEAFKKCDIIISPTTATTAFKIGEKSDDHVAMYLNDIFTVPINIAGLPAMSIPCGVSEKNGMPIGMQIIAPHFEEGRIFNVADFYENNKEVQ